MASVPRALSGAGSGVSSDATATGAESVAGATASSGRTRNIGQFSSHFATVRPVAVAQRLASRAVPTMAVGFCACWVARIAMAVVGMSWMLAVLMARKVHMALVAVPGTRLSLSKSRMARSPRGVAALARPSMLAAMFMSIEPIAG